MIASAPTGGQKRGHGFQRGRISARRTIDQRILESDRFLKFPAKSGAMPRGSLQRFLGAYDFAQASMAPRQSQARLGSQITIGNVEPGESVTISGDRAPEKTLRAQRLGAEQKGLSLNRDRKCSHQKRQGPIGPSPIEAPSRRIEPIERSRVHQSMIQNPPPSLLKFNLNKDIMPLMTLDEIAIGRPVRILALTGPDESERARMTGLGLRLGATITKVLLTPLRDPVECLVGPQLLTIERRILKRIQVEPLR